MSRLPRLLFSGSRTAPEQEAGHSDHQRQHQPGGERQHPAPGLLSRGRRLHHDIGGVHADRSPTGAQIQEKPAVQGALLPPPHLPGRHPGLLPHHLHRPVLVLMDSHGPGGGLGLGDFLHEERAEQEGAGLWLPSEELHLRLQPRGVHLRLPSLAHLCHRLHAEGGAHPRDLHPGPHRAQGPVRCDRLQNHHAAVRPAALLPHQLHHRGLKRCDATPLPELLHEHLLGPAGQLHTGRDAAEERDPLRLPEVHRHLGVFRGPGRPGYLALRADRVGAALPVAVGPVLHRPGG